MNDKLWLLGERKSAPKLRLFCFPYAGGAAHAFSTWQNALPHDIEVLAIQMPGRGTRLAEPPIDSMAELIPLLAQVVQAKGRTPFAFFGHSLGALVAFELTRFLRRHRLYLPQHLIVSGADAPRCRDTSRSLHTLPDAELIDALRDYEGSPPEVLENNELMALLLPMIRADFAIADNYAYAPSLPLNIPISVLIGSSDRHSSDDTASEWAKESSKPCIAHYFDGGHFFIHSHRAQVLETICSELCQVTEHA